MNEETGTFTTECEDIAQRLFGLNGSKPDIGQVVTAEKFKHAVLTGSELEPIYAELEESGLPQPPKHFAEQIQQELTELGLQQYAWEGGHRRRTDLGNAERFIDLYGDRVRYVYEWKEQGWLWWDRTRWVRYANDEIEAAVGKTIRSVYSEAAEDPDAASRKRLADWAKSSEASGRINSLLTWARNSVALSPEELDRHPMLLNVENGVLDLKTSELRPHDPELLLTRRMPMRFDPEAGAPTFEAAMELWTADDKELARFLQVAIGYTLTGRVDEHCTFFLYGDGRNGKSTWSDLWRRFFGDYSAVFKTEALFLGGLRGIRSMEQLSLLEGARYALGDEIKSEVTLNAAALKDLTGGDVRRAGRLYQQAYDYEPTDKLWLYGNHTPKITDTDLGIWRRIRLVPFTANIRNQRNQSELIADLLAEASGILNWALEGCRIWQAEGLQMVPAVEAATDRYRSEQDVLQQFMEEVCQQGKGRVVRCDDLYNEMLNWAKRNQEGFLDKKSKRWLTSRLKSLGIPQRGRGDSRMYIGIGLRDSPNQEEIPF